MADYKLLEAFVGHADDIRFWMLTPFRFDGSTYATRGSLIVRMDGECADYPELESEKTRKNIQKIWKGKDLSATSSLPDLRNLKLCHYCHGSGKDLGADGITQTDEPCPSCGGDKMTECDNPFLIGDNYLDGKLLVKIQPLPCVRFSGTPAREKPQYFVFDGGDGFVMPLDYISARNRAMELLA